MTVTIETKEWLETEQMTTRADQKYKQKINAQTETWH